MDSLEQSLAQVSGADQLLMDDGMDLDAVPEDALLQEAATAGLQDWGSHGGAGAEVVLFKTLISSELQLRYLTRTEAAR